ELGESEIGNPQMAVSVHHQIAGFDVAMNDAILVGVFERLGGLDAEAGDGAIITVAVCGERRGQSADGFGVDVGRWGFSVRQIRSSRWNVAGVRRRIFLPNPHSLPLSLRAP